MAVPTIFVSLTGYIQSLVTYAEQKGSAAELEALRDKLFEQIQTGDGKTLVNSSPGGKSFTFEVNMTTEQQFQAVVRAIEIYNGAVGSSPFTFVDLSRSSGSSNSCNPGCTPC